MKATDETVFDIYFEHTKKYNSLTLLSKMAFRDEIIVEFILIFILIGL